MSTLARLCFAAGLILWYSTTPLPAQPATLIRDSIHCERGIPGTQNFAPESRILFPRYDEAGRLLEEIHEERMAGGQWEPVRRRSFSYSGDKLSERRLQSWDAASQTWQDRRLDRYQYSEGLLREYVRQQAKDGQLHNDRRWVYAYNEAGRQTSMLIQDWRMEDWHNLSRKLTSYGPEGLLQRQTLQQWQNDDWLPTRSRRWDYAPINGSPRVQTTTMQRWSAAQATWIDQSRKRFAYSDEGLWIASVFEDWDAAAMAWVNTDRMQYQYDAQRIPTGQVLQKWEGDWQNHGRALFDQSQQVFASRIDNWDNDVQQWTHFLRYQIVTDDDNRLLQKTGMQAWNAASGEWENRAFTQRYTHFWSPLMVSSPEATPPPLACLIANPYRPGTPFSCALPAAAQPYRLELYDLLGRRVYTDRLSGGQDLQLAIRPAAGTYLLRIVNQDRLYHLQRLLIL